MNNGVIKAADVEYYINGGCTPDESELVNKKYAVAIDEQFSCKCHILFCTNICLTSYMISEQSSS